MWKQKLGLGTNSTYGIDIPEQIRLFAETGYEAFFTDWTAEAPIADYAALARETGMLYQSIHAPFGSVAALWAEDREKGDSALGELRACLESCAKNEVPIMVSHAFIGFHDHTPTAVGLERFGVLVRDAERYGVKIAFENTEGEEYLSALLQAFSGNRQVGFCWDSGHEMCYNHSQDLLALYGERLLCTHLNDNLGIRDHSGVITFHDDLHLLPFDGIADWDAVAQRLQKCGFNEVLMFELNTQSKPHRHENDRYRAVPIAEYIAMTYARACRVAAKLEKCKTAHSL